MVFEHAGQNAYNIQKIHQYGMWFISTVLRTLALHVVQLNVVGNISLRECQRICVQLSETYLEEIDPIRIVIRLFNIV